MSDAAYPASEPSLALGAVLRDTFRLYRGLFWRNVLTACLIFAVVCLAQSVGPWPVVLLSFVGTALVQGALVQAVADERARLPRSSIGDLYRSAGRHLGPLVGVALLTGIGVGVGLFLLVVPGLILFTRWSLAVPAVMIEGRSPREALRRSADLVQGRGWAVFAVFFTVTVAAALASVLMEVALVGAVGLWASLTLAGTLTTPFAAHALNVVYYRIVEPGAPLLSE